MGKMKEEFIRLAEERFLQSSLFDLMGFVSRDEQLREEKFDLTRGDYKTTVTIKFNKDGRPVMHSLESTYEPSVNHEKIKELRIKLDSAIKQEAYLQADTIAKQIKELETNT